MCSVQGSSIADAFQGEAVHGCNDPVGVRAVKAAQVSP